MSSKCNLVHLKALLKINFLKMKAERKKSIAELMFTIGYGVLIGWEISNSLNNPDMGGLGYVIFILICPAAFQQSCIYIFNEMVKDRETKMKESLKIMGLNKYMYALSFLLQRAIWVTFTCLIMSIMILVMNSGSLSFGQVL